MKEMIDYFRENENVVIVLEEGAFSLAKNKRMIKLEMNNGKVMISDDESELMEFYEDNGNGSEFRVCTVCGAPIEQGYMVDGDDFYACSDECRDEDYDRVYGKGKWKKTNELTEEEKKNTAWDEFKNDAYHVFLDKDGKWHPDYVFHTTWF